MLQNLSKSKRSRRVAINRRLCGKVCATGCATALLSASAVNAQTISQAGSYGGEVLTIPAFETTPTPGDNILRYGPWDVLPRIRASGTYDDNIYIQQTGKTSDFIWTFSPGVMLGAGDYRTREASSAIVDYAPSVNLFTQHSRNNSIDHDARLRAEWKPGRWSASVEQLYQNFSGPVLDVGNRVNRSFYDTGLAFGYEISPKTSVELTGNQLVTDYEGASSYNEWIVGGFFDYALTPKIKVGAGVNVGWADIQNAGNQTYQQGLVRAVYSATEKLDFRGSAGIEVREFQTGQDDRLNGVFSIGGTYKPIEFTSILFDAYRRDQNSVVLADQNYTTTGFGLGVRREFLVKYAATITGGYDHLHYQKAGPTAGTVNRVDDYYFIRGALDWRALDRLTAGVFYLYRKNSSNTNPFDNHQVGVNVAYQF